MAAPQKNEAFKSNLDAESLEAFNKAASESFSKQACFFLNAFWEEYGDQAEYIYSIIWDTIKSVDMEHKGVKYVHKYEEGADLDFDMSLYLFEQLCKFKDQPDKFRQRADWVAEHKGFQETYAKSMPAMMTSIVRKKALRESVDVNFDGRVGMLEYLLYQYDASPKSLMERSMAAPEEDADIRKARLALEEVTKAIQAYEAEKSRLETAAAGAGVKALTAKNQLAQLESSPLMENLNRALITAEAAVRIATKKAKNGGGAPAGAAGGAAGGGMRSDGAIWWMKRDLAEKKRKYGRRKK